MRLLGTVITISILATCSAFTLSAPEWDDLKVTWEKFATMPRKTSDAESEGFKMVSDCGDITGIYGKRYVKGEDYALVLLYGVNGYIAGIQIGVAKNNTGAFPPLRQIGHPFVNIGDMYYLTAYFIKPETICTTGRTPAQFDADGTGDALYIQNGTDAAVHSLVIPKEESGISSTKWTKGHCFYTMGMHYWYDVKADMNCDDFFPVFLLYNQGKLNAFGWAIDTSMSSERMEHPPESTIKLFIDPVPQCLLQKQQLSTMHIFLTSSPITNFC
ncbi:uncharacterized protein LOC117329006 isoform X2 [Pecten maximus]|uniref:uncharacterized protein LOC117329006 isoform X2 n=1 Tax=Pecten maximus TaxID=6579 RepID=UPI0014591B7B|nr:uncharacterized protein LOC117329006 isoform X2 [Pecten maximus]